MSNGTGFIPEPNVKGKVVAVYFKGNNCYFTVEGVSLTLSQPRAEKLLYRLPEGALHPATAAGVIAALFAKSHISVWAHAFDPNGTIPNEIDVPSTGDHLEEMLASQANIIKRPKVEQPLKP